MKIIPIFEIDSGTKEGLYAIRYDGEKENEFDRLFSLWIKDIRYVSSYLKANEDYLDSGYFKEASLRDIAIRIKSEAMELLRLFDDFSCRPGDKKLQEIFRPLVDDELNIRLHQKTKASIENWKYRRAILRIYAIRISSNAYVVTGGAIKLVKSMKDHEDTRRELEKIETVRKYLTSIELYTEDDLIYLL